MVSTTAYALLVAGLRCGLNRISGGERPQPRQRMAHPAVLPYHRAPTTLTPLRLYTPSPAAAGLQVKMLRPPLSLRYRSPSSRVAVSGYQEALSSRGPETPTVAGDLRPLANSRCGRMNGGPGQTKVISPGGTFAPSPADLPGCQESSRWTHRRHAPVGAANS